MLLRLFHCIFYFQQQQDKHLLYYNKENHYFQHFLLLLHTHIMRLLISLWDVGTVFFTIYPQVFRHEKSSIYYKYIEPLSYCFSISFKILIITVYGFMKWYICKCLFCKVYLLDLSYNRNAKPMTGSNELRFNLTQIRG